jgi:hypothetical protein
LGTNGQPIDIGKGDRRTVKMKPLHYKLKGMTKFFVPAEKLAQFDAAQKDGKWRVSIDVELPKSSHTVGFEASDVISGKIQIGKEGAKPGLYSLSVDAVVATLSLGKKEAAEIEKGKASCQFSDVGYLSDWYPEMQFEEGGHCSIEYSK